MIKATIHQPVAQFERVCLFVSQSISSLWAAAAAADCHPYLSCGAASSLTVRPRVGVEWPCVLLGGLHHSLCHRQVWGADVGPGERPLLPGRLRAAVT